ncbi:PDZ domain-containing protein [Ornithinimicrobium cerasi]|uniref:endopeptidase La n=1 Tax=Ornithinimicrobium cerasi TaxID=2248773 RepID=A0A285VSM5_9MICO|nr:PDZ domain-containing protein [Ornithinimicrobium cerasi]
MIDPGVRRRRGGEGPPHTGVGPFSWALIVTVVLAVVLGAALGRVRVDQVAYHPGPVYDTLGAIDDTTVVQLDEDLPTYPTDGDLYFTTIRISGGPGNELNVWDWLEARLDPRTTLVPKKDVFPEDVTAQQVREQNTSLMQHSQQDAAVVALRASGIEVPEKVMVAQIIVDAPADGVLEVDDQILEVEGDPVSETEAVRERLQEVTPGESATMTLLRDGEEVEIDVPTRRDEDTGRTIVGVYLAPDYQTPYDVTVSAGNVGGPSAGLMFALAIYDTITPGSLTEGRSFAGTGAISGNGSVRPIGGIAQKMWASQEAGAEVFLAPTENCDEVVERQPGGLTVVPVSTFDEARGYVEQVASAQDPATLDLPTCQEVLAGQQDGSDSTG